MAHQFYLDDLANTVVGEIVTLSGEEGHHAAKVSRVRTGEKLQLTDGRGTRAFVTVDSVSASAVMCRVDSCVFEPQRLPAVTLVQALAKTDRDERAIESATELGVTSVIPWQAHRSVSRWAGEKRAKGRTRWQSVVRETCKQSLRSWAPEVHELCETDALPHALEGHTIIVLDARGSETFASLPEVSLNKPLAIVVGPEGGITETEIELLRHAGAHVVTLGSHILRTSTAGPALIAMINERCARW